jgi:lipoate---protein ligase
MNIARRWRVEEHQGNAAGLHAGSAALLDPLTDRPPGRTARLLTSTDLALVMGSAQPEVHVDRERAGARGVAIVRRRSGGGAVMVGPGLTVWVDLVVPAADPLWADDVGRACWWVGEAWAAALARAGLPGGAVWRGAQIRSPWSDRVCFAGLGAGEVTMAGRKLVGISQRRTRAGALFQCAASVTWDPAPLLEVLRLLPEERERAASDLASAAAGVGDGRAKVLAAALVDCLP